MGNDKKPSGQDEPPKLSRRGFLAPLAFAPLSSKAAPQGLTAAQTPDAEIREAQFSSFRTLLTPNEEFFVRNHFRAPKLSQSSDSMLFLTADTLSEMNSSMSSAYLGRRIAPFSIRLTASES